MWPNWFQEGSISERKHSTPRRLINFGVGLRWCVLSLKRKKETANKTNKRGHIRKSRADICFGWCWVFSSFGIKMQAVAFVHVVAHSWKRSAKRWNPRRSHLLLLLLWDLDFWLVLMSIAGNGRTETAAATEEWVLLSCPTWFPSIILYFLVSHEALLFSSTKTGVRPLLNTSLEYLHPKIPTSGLESLGFVSPPVSPRVQSEPLRDRYSIGF